MINPAINVNAPVRSVGRSPRSDIRDLERGAAYMEVGWQGIAAQRQHRTKPAPTTTTVNDATKNDDREPEDDEGDEQPRQPLRDLRRNSSGLI